jgi:hypothetical protein
MGLRSVLVDQARPVEQREAGVRVEGRTVFRPVKGEWFKCRLTLPLAIEDAPGTAGLRQVPVQPTILLGTKDVSGGAVELHNDLRLEIVSKQLGSAVWDVVGEPEPLRKKRKVIGYQATVRQIILRDADRD